MSKKRNEIEIKQESIKNCGAPRFIMTKSMRYLLWGAYWSRVSALQLQKSYNLTVGARRVQPEKFQRQTKCTKGIAEHYIRF